MQTFLPYSSFAATAGLLDVRRLGKQRVEVLQVVADLGEEDRVGVEEGARPRPAG